MGKLAKKENVAVASVAATEPKVPATTAGEKVTRPKSKKKSRKLNKRGRGSRHTGVIFIKHLPKGFDEEALSQFFCQFGDIVKVCVARSKKTQQVKGYGYVQFKFYEVAEIAASAVDNYMLFGRVLKTSVLPKTIKAVPHTFGRKFKSKEDCVAFHKQRLERRVKTMNKPLGNENARVRCLKQVKRLKRATEEMREAGIELPELQNQLSKLGEKITVLKGQVQEDLVKRAAAAEEAAAAKAAALAAKAASEAAAAAAKAASEAAASKAAGEAAATKAADESTASSKTVEAIDDQEMKEVDDQEGDDLKWKKVITNNTNAEGVAEKTDMKSALDKAQAAAKKLAQGTLKISEPTTNSKKQQATAKKLAQGTIKASEPNTNNKKQKLPSAEKKQENAESQTTLKKKPSKKELKEAPTQTQAQKDQQTLPKKQQIEKKLSNKQKNVQVEKDRKVLLEKKQQSGAKGVPSQEKTQPKNGKPALAKKKQSEEKLVSTVEKRQAKKDKPKTFEKKQSDASVVTPSPKVKRKLSIKDTTKPAKMVRKVK